jgi:hypothetical protein
MNFWLFSALPDYGDFVCDITQRVSFILPSSPYTLSGLATDLASTVPFVGSGFIYSMLQDISSVLLCVGGYKVLKILPGRF